MKVSFAIMILEERLKDMKRSLAHAHLLDNQYKSLKRDIFVLEDEIEQIKEKINA